MIPVFRAAIVTLLGVAILYITIVAFYPMLMTTLPAEVYNNVDGSTAFGENSLNVTMPIILLAIVSLPGIIIFGIGLWSLFYSIKEETGDILITGSGAGRW